MNALHKWGLRTVVVVLIVHFGAKPMLDVVRMLAASEFARSIFFVGMLVGLIVPVAAPKLIEWIGLLRLHIAALPMPGLERLISSKPKPSPRKKAA